MANTASAELVILPDISTSVWERNDDGTDEIRHPDLPTEMWDDGDQVSAWRVYSVNHSEPLGTVYRFHGGRWKYTTLGMTNYSSPFPSVSDAATRLYRRYLSTAD